ncbi:hypothetical protein MATR_25380 [Marivirga tractuosa]|uniref:DUF547 domain-containing protein n=1 Tax=Marivirga tractuosa (strain ATCC 23168 / DSM 4126 / NBRC 15989 / NCIMB 1408 / VKM B-1430 / H-43) TaxID=643867 RepID=E4TPR9_MARTH|nr:DUF547 domain-containing protein [Marivirga tractuosa]ADR23606.1 protein of unknown function DUF547 [Marivirga tractuosa DSM 4126]BDD15713.1 hypothetical protein MATR_25380 [Marivirga tractuosa]
MKRFSLTLFSFYLVFFSFSSLGQSKINKEPNEFVRLSMNLISAVKNSGDYQKYVNEYKALPLKELAESLDTDQKIKAFWINTYNAYVQIILTDDPSLFDDRGAFFKADQVNVGGELLSLDFIEHGIIRGSKVKLSMGFLNDPFASKLEKQFRVDDADGRIHFALNCGATSCPYVAVYSAYELDKELDQITRQFLKRTTDYNKSEDEVYVTTLFSWFKGDFSDGGGVIGFLKKYDCIPEDADPKVNYKDYDWTLDLGNFIELQ